MAWPKLKQYLENSWYRWASQDRQTGYAAQYQYWYWVNTRDMKNGVCLAWWSKLALDVGEKFVYFCRQNKLYTLSYSWVIRDMEWTVKCTISSFWNNVDVVICENFWDYLFIANDTWKVFQVDVALWTYTDVTSYISWFTTSTFLTMLNYANTFLLIWCWDVLIRAWFELWAITWKVVRDFDSSYHIVWLTQEWNYLKIYTTDNKDTKIHYAKGTFDVEYTWLVQTVSFKWLSIPRNCVAHDQWNDYVLFRVKDWEYKLAKISWYNKVDIRWTQTWWWEKVFTAYQKNLIWPSIYAADWVLFANMEDWIWTFIEYNGWLWWWCCEFPTAWNEFVDSLFKFWEELYYCNVDLAIYCDMSFHPQTYQSHWFIISRVFDGWCAGLFKKNDQATITYNMPTGTSMELSYRYDRESFWYDKSNFISIKKLTDVNSCYDIVVPTTPSNTDEYVLLKEDWDKILLENWNWIKLEDKLVCPFNKTWNLLEYRFDLDTTDTTKTPILFEHSLTYYDYMRKYR
jgi:hypothetical protein